MSDPLWDELEARDGPHFADLMRLYRRLPRYNGDVGLCWVCSFGATSVLRFANVTWASCVFCNTGWNVDGDFDLSDKAYGPDAEMVLDVLAQRELRTNFTERKSMETTTTTATATGGAPSETAEERIARLIASDEPLPDFWNWNVIQSGRAARRRRQAEEGHNARRVTEQESADGDLRDKGQARLSAEDRAANARRVNLAESFERCRGFCYEVRPGIFVAAVEIARRLRAGAEYQRYYPLLARAVWYQELAAR